MLQTLQSPSAERPVLLIVAGPNGSGKSTAYLDVGLQPAGRPVWIINPDLLAARIRNVEKLSLNSANIEAVRRIEAWLHTSVSAHQTVGVETVLSTGKYRKLVLAAKKLQFEIQFYYVILDSPDRNVQRVRLRVKAGGHAVPEDKIRERYVRSLEQMPWFLEHADQAWLIDNSGAEPRLIGMKQHGTIRLDEDILPVVDRAVRTISSD